MNDASRWFRLNCDWWESEWLSVLSAEARLAWVLFLGRAKTHGSGGVLKKSPTELLARQWLIGEEAILQVLKAAEQNGAVTSDGNSWLITGWAKFQGDPTAAERQAEFRRRRQLEKIDSQAEPVEPKKAKRNGSNALRNGVTVTETVTETVTMTETNTANAVAVVQEPPGLWGKYLSHHKERSGKDYSKAGKEQLLTKLAHLGEARANALIEFVIDRNWQGIPADYLPHLDGTPPKQTVISQQPATLTPRSVASPGLTNPGWMEDEHGTA